MPIGVGVCFALPCLQSSAISNIGAAVTLEHVAMQTGVSTITGGIPVAFVAISKDDRHLSRSYHRLFMPVGDWLLQYHHGSSDEPGASSNVRNAARNN